jgi:hypothetical protein
MIVRMVDSSSPRPSCPDDATLRRLEAQHLQKLEGNPLTEDEIATFEMFERENWPEERCLAYIRAKFAGQAPPHRRNERRPLRLSGDDRSS